MPITAPGIAETAAAESAPRSPVQAGQPAQDRLPTTPELSADCAAQQSPQAATTPKTAATTSPSQAPKSGERNPADTAPVARPSPRSAAMKQAYSGGASPLRHRSMARTILPSRCANMRCLCVQHACYHYSWPYSSLSMLSLTACSVHQAGGIVQRSYPERYACCRSPFPTTGTPLDPIAEGAHEPRTFQDRTSAGSDGASPSPRQQQPQQQPALQQSPLLQHEQRLASAHPADRPAPAPAPAPSPKGRITELWEAEDDASDLVPPTGGNVLARTPPVRLLCFQSSLTDVFATA